MTTGSDEPGTSAMPSELQITPKLDRAYFNENLFYAPPKGNTKKRIELCKTILPVRESPVSPPPHERGPSQHTPLLQTGTSGFHASYHIQNALPYTDMRKLHGMRKICGRDQSRENNEIHGSLNAEKLTGLYYNTQEGSLH